MEAIVQAAGVADGVSRVVAPPQRGDGAGAVEAGNCQTVVVILGGTGVRFGWGVLLDHHTVVERGAAFARCGAARAVAPTVALTGAFQKRQNRHSVGQTLQIYRPVVVVAAVV